MASSFTIWYKKRAGTKAEPFLELHLNLWIFDQSDNSIDIGLKISKPRSIDELYMYIPFVVKDQDLINLTKIIKGDKETSELLFNENVTFRKNAGQILQTTINSKRLDYYFVDGIILDELDEQKLEEGRIIKFIFDDSLNNDDKYIRLRINNIKDKGIIERHEKVHSTLTGAYNTVTSMEINFHEFRKLPHNIYQKAHSNHLKVSLVNLFVMTDMHMEYIFSNIKNVKSRILEKDKWEKYNSKLKRVKKNGVLAYQFKQKPEENQKYLEDFSIFAKYNYEAAGKVRVYVTYLIIFLLGIGSSLSANPVKEWYMSSLNEIKRVYKNLNDVNSSDNNSSEENRSSS